MRGSNGSAASFAKTQTLWSLRLQQRGSEGFVSLFDGKTLEGWDGSEKFWSVEDGCITGRSSEDNPVPYSTFLIWKGEPVKDFTLLVDFCISSQGNSGIEYRAWKDAPRTWAKWLSSGHFSRRHYGDSLRRSAWRNHCLAWRSR